MNDSLKQGLMMGIIIIHEVIILHIDKITGKIIVSMANNSKITIKSFRIGMKLPDPKKEG